MCWKYKFNLKQIRPVSPLIINAEQESQGYQGDQQIQGKRQPKMTENEWEYRLSTLENKRAKLLSRLLRKSSEIDGLMYSYQNHYYSY